MMCLPDDTSHPKVVGPPISRRMGASPGIAPLSREDPMTEGPDPEIDFRLDGLVAVVVGGAGGIGEAVVHGMRDQGARVVILDLPREVLDGDVDLFPCDITDPTR